MKLIEALKDVRKVKPPKRKQISKQFSVLDVSNIETLTETVMALGELGDRSVVPALRGGLNRESVALAKDYFAMALCKLGDSSAVPIFDESSEA